MNTAPVDRLILASAGASVPSAKTSTGQLWFSAPRALVVEDRRTGEASLWVTGESEAALHRTEQAFTTGRQYHGRVWLFLGK